MGRKKERERESKRAREREREREKERDLGELRGFLGAACLQLEPLLLSRVLFSLLVFGDRGSVFLAEGFRFRVSGIGFRVVSEKGISVGV